MNTNNFINEYKEYRKCYDLFDYVLYPQVFEEYIAIITKNSNKYDVNVYSTKTFNVVFYFSTEIEIESYVFAGNSIFIQSGNKIHTFKREQLVKTLKVDGEILNVEKNINWSKENNKICVAYAFYKNGGKYFVKELDGEEKEFEIFIEVQNNNQIKDNLNNEKPKKTKIDNNFTFTHLYAYFNNKVILTTKTGLSMHSLSKNKILFTKNFGRDQIVDLKITQAANIIVIKFKKFFMVFDIKKGEEVYKIDAFEDCKIENVQLSNIFMEYACFRTGEKCFIFNMNKRKIIYENTNNSFLYMFDSTDILQIKNHLELLKKNNKGTYKISKTKYNIGNIKRIFRCKDNSQMMYLVCGEEMYKINVFNDKDITKINYTVKDTTDLILKEFNDVLFLYDKETLTIIQNNKVISRIQRRMDWFESEHECILFGHGKNIYLVFYKTKSVGFHVDLSEKIENSKDFKTTCVCFTRNKVILNVQCFTNNAKKSILLFIKHSCIEYEIERNIDIHENISNFIFEDDKIYFIENDKIKIIDCYTFLIKDTKIMSTRFDLDNNVLISYDQNIIYFYDSNNFKLLNVFKGKNKVEKVLSIKGHKCIGVMDELKIFNIYTVRNIFIDQFLVQTEKEEDQSKKETNSILMFLENINKNLKVHELNSNKSNKMSFVKEKMSLYNEIAFYKNCLIKNDVEFYLKSLTREETEKIVEYILEHGKVKTFDYLMNRILMYKGRYLDKEILQKVLDVFK